MKRQSEGEKEPTEPLRDVSDRTPNPARARSISELEAKRRVYRSTLRKVWGVLRRKGCPETELLDLAHKTYAIAFSKWDTFRGDSQRDTWVVGIALNVARDHLRRHSGSRFEAFSEEGLGASNWVAAESSPEEEAHWRQRLRLLRLAMKQLRSDQRELLELILLQHLSVSDAARTLGISQRQAYTLKDAGVTQLVAILRRHA